MNSILATVSQFSVTTIALSVVAATVVLALIFKKTKTTKGNQPPFIPYTIPFIGSMITFGQDPINFLLKNYEKHGEVFTFLMFGRKITYLMGCEGNGAFVNAKGSDASAEAAYKSLTVPVFGKGVIYDVPNHVMVEQKKMCKGALTHEAFESYVPLIEEETRQYFERWGQSGVVDLLEALSEVTIMTASRCLLGKEVRSKLNEGVAQLYHDLDGGFTPLNFLFPNLPLPSYRKRDEAHIKMRNLFIDIIKKRRETNDNDNCDLMQTLMNSEYKDGRRMSDQEVAHMMIAVLMAGQHTSSATGTWMGLYLADHKDIVENILKEQEQIFGKEPSFNYEGIRKLEYMDSVLKETLRLRPPIFQIMRMLLNDFEYKGYTIPAGHYICMSPTATHVHSDNFVDPLKFNPDRFAPDAEEEKRFSYLPFGGGRHRCIGEGFAYIQIKTVWSTILSLYDIELDGPMPQPCFDSLIVLPSKPCNIRYKRKETKKTN